VEHTATIGLNHAEVVRDVAQDSHPAAVRLKQFLKHSSADQMEELRHSYRVWNGKGPSDGGSGCREWFYLSFNSKPRCHIRKTFEADHSRVSIEWGGRAQIALQFVGLTENLKLVKPRQVTSRYKKIFKVILPKLKRHRNDICHNSDHAETEDQVKWAEIWDIVFVALLQSQNTPRTFRNDRIRLEGRAGRWVAAWPKKRGWRYVMRRADTGRFIEIFMMSHGKRVSFATAGTYDMMAVWKKRYRTPKTIGRIG
jgi:hypothetical protein